MNGFNIIMVIAIILFARLGVRLFAKWRELKNSSLDQDNTQQGDDLDDENDLLKK